MSQIFEVHTPHGNLTPDYFIDVQSRTVPDWVLRIARPHNGPVPKGRPVFPVDVDAEEREAAALKIPPPPDNISEDEVKHDLGLTDEQLAEAREQLNFPKGRAQYTTNGLIGEVIAIHRIYRRVEVEKWAAAARRVFSYRFPPTNSRR